MTFDGAVSEIHQLTFVPFFCRYQGKTKTLMYDITKIISALKVKRGDHRVFRLAENLCINLILSQRDFFSVKREGKVCREQKPFSCLFLLFLWGMVGYFIFILFYFNSLQGPNEFTETLNRIIIITLAITIKTRGIADADHLLYLQTMLEQIIGTSQHTWSEKTLRYFPPILRDTLIGRIDKRGMTIQAWQQVCYCISFLLLNFFFSKFWYSFAYGIWN